MFGISWLLPFIIFILAVVINWYIPSRPRDSTQPSTATHKDNKPARSLYNEEEIVQLMKDIYRTYLQLNYIQRWEIIWPPRETGHAINEALCAELGLDPAVVSLMKRIPYITSYSVAKDIEFFTWSRAMVYTLDDEIRGGRDPFFFEFQEPRLDHLLPHEITLICDGDEGSNIILDIKENTIRVEGFHGRPPGPDAPVDHEYVPERPDDGNHYRNFYPHHAPTWLAGWLAKIRALEVVPVNPNNGYRTLHSEDEKTGAVIKQIFQDKYGWPDNFREAAWRRAGCGVTKQVSHSHLDKKVVVLSDIDFSAYEEGDDKDALECAGSVMYAEEIDGPRGGPLRYPSFLYSDAVPVV